MSLLLVVLLGALGLGWALGGSLDRLGSLRLRLVLLVLLAVAAQVLGGLVGGVAYPVGLVLSAVLATVFLAVNRRLPGIGLVALGIASNALVVCLNGAMPVSAAAAERLGVDLVVLAGSQDPRHEPADAATRLAVLGDVVPVRLPVRPEVVSVGDVLLAAGVGRLVLLGMRASRTAGVGRARSVPVLCTDREGAVMAKRGRKRRARKKNAANHGKRPNA